MTSIQKGQIDVSGFRADNWGGAKEQPPVVFNRDTSAHAGIAWAWSQAVELRDLTLIGLQITEADTNERALLEVFLARLDGLEAVLRELGDRSANRDAKPETRRRKLAEVAR